MVRRADRLFAIVQHLRGGRLNTARKLAERLEVSERTVYRDIADLQGSGVPIEGAAGVGYLLREGFDLPPLMFSRDEMVALVAGARLVQAFGGASMARSAVEALVKIAAVLPAGERERLTRIEIHGPVAALTLAERAALDGIEAAIDARTVLSFAYRDEKGAPSRRDVRPLGLWFWGTSWTLVAWCELRKAFRMFRVDRLSELGHTGRTFRPEPGKRLVDFYRLMEAEGHGPPPEA